MASPFPGMDPYLEAGHLWEDFHGKLIGDIERALTPLLPERYAVRLGERSYVALMEPDEEPDRSAFVPDVAVTANRRPAKGTRKPQATAATVEKSTPAPVPMRAMVKMEYREPFLEIRQVDPERKLVTSIEVLSPSNKRPNTKGWRQYHRKRLAFLSGRANFVEIDLLRRGRRMPMASRWPDSPYYLLVCRKKEAPNCKVWPVSFLEPLPTLPIPLAPPDADVNLDLQPLIAALYARSRYERDIDYRQPLYPPLNAADAAWLQKRLRHAPANK